MIGTGSALVTQRNAGDWARAEALLEEAVVSLRAEPTVVIMLALCQSRRGKLQSAIVNARRACTPQPRNKEHAKFLIDLLLEAGYFREAQERLFPGKPKKIAGRKKRSQFLLKIFC